MDKIVSQVYYRKRISNQRHNNVREVIDALRRKYEHDIAILNTKLTEHKLPPAEVLAQPPAEVLAQPPAEVLVQPPAEVLAQPPAEVLAQPPRSYLSKSSIRKGKVISKGIIQ